MKSKISRAAISGILFSFIVFYFGCNKNSSTGPDDSQVIGSGSDYFPLTGNQTISGEADYQYLNYDSIGNITDNQMAVNQEVKMQIGLATTVGGVQAYPLYGYKQDGKTLISSNVVVAQDSKSIVAFETIGNKFTVLPADIKLGTKWIANPFAPQIDQVTLQITDSKSSYTNSADKTYSNVLKVSIAYSDSATVPYSWSYNSGSDWYSCCETDFVKIAANADIYFAKGTGIIDVRMNNFEAIDRWAIVDSSYYQNWWNGSSYVDTLMVAYYKGYERITAQALLGRMDAPGDGSIVAQDEKMHPLKGTNELKAEKGKSNFIDFLFGNHRTCFENRKHSNQANGSCNKWIEQ